MRCSTLSSALLVGAMLFAAGCDDSSGGGTDDVGSGGDEDPPPSDCGPVRATVANVIDGDTVDLDTGDRVRYLMIDTPEITGGNNDCWGEEARQANEDLVLGQEVTLRYDEECTDRFGRLLAYVSVGSREINSLLVERGHACVLYIPPNGTDRQEEFFDLEFAASMLGRGVWGACEVVTCD